MAISIVNQWDITGGPSDLQQTISPAQGNWLVAIVTWKSVTTAVQPVINLADAGRNLWFVPSTRTTSANNTFTSSTGPLNAQVWVCPAVAYPGWNALRVYTAIASFGATDVGSLDVKLLEIGGMGNGFLTVDSVVTATAATANGVTLNVPAPVAGADCLMIAAASGDIAYGSYSTTGAGWTQLDNVTNTNPECGLFSAWREGTTSSSVTFSLVAGFNRNWSGVAVSIRQTGVAPSQPNPNWPATEMQLGLGYDLSSPLSGVYWTTLQQPFPSVSTKRGIQYELGTAQAEPTDIVLRNSDGALTPKAVVTATASAAGTTTTILVPDAQASGIAVGDFFRLTRVAALNSNTGFEAGTTGWTPTGGTLTTTTSVVQDGTQAGQLTPDGVTATVRVDQTPTVPVTAGGVYTASGWLQCAVARTVNLNVNWYDAGSTFLSTGSNAMSIAANTWTFLTADFVAPAGAAFGKIIPTMTGTPPVSNVLYLDDIVFKVRPEFTVFKVTALSSVSGTTTVTFTAADGSGAALSATASGDVYASTPVDLYTPYRLVMAWNNKRHVVSAGWAESWPQVWDKDGFVGEITMTGTGALANLTAANPSTLAGEITRRNPYAYWKLSDAGGAPLAVNSAARSTTQLVPTASKNGAGSASATAGFGASTQGVSDSNSTPPIVSSLLGDPGNGWQQTGLTTADLNAGKGTALIATDANFPSITNGVTIYFVHYVSAADDTAVINSTVDPTVVMVRNTDPSAGAQGSVIKFGWKRSTGNPRVTVWDKSTHALTGTDCTLGGQWAAAGFISGALMFNQTSWRAYTQNGALAGSGTCNLASGFSILNVGGEADRFFNGNCAPGILAHVAVFDRMLTGAEIAQLDVAMGAMPTELTAVRVQRKLDVIGSKNGRLLSTDGVAQASYEAVDASTVADACSQVGGYEDALVFEDAAGNLQYRPPQLYGSQVSRATLGERTDLGEVPYLAGVESDFDLTYLYNLITVNNVTKTQDWHTDALATTPFAATDQTSVTKRMPRTLDRTVRLYNPQGAFYLANWLLSQYSTPRQRIAQVTIDPASNPNVWLFCLTVEVGDLVTVMRRPLTAAPISLQCVVLQVEQQGSPGAWKTTLTLAPARPSQLILNDPARGIVGSNVMGPE